MIGTPPGVVTPLTEQAETADDLLTIFFWIAVGIAVMVLGLVAYVVIRYRRRDDTLPRQIHAHIPLEVVYTAVPFVIVVGLFGLTVGALGDFDDLDDDPDVDIHITAFQWQWQFVHGDGDVTVTGTEAETPELVLPASTKVRFELESVDVIHSFWIPGFRFKRDMFPSETTAFQVDVADETGLWDNVGVCAEFCGLDHHKMQFSVRVVTPDEYAEWLSDSAQSAGGDT